MVKLMRRSSKKAGLPPGTIIPVTGDDSVPTVISYMDYNEETFDEKQKCSLEECISLKDKKTVSWINLNGLGTVDVLEKAGAEFGLHSLVLEDIANTGQRPKFEDLDDNLFIILKMLKYDEVKREITIEQVSLVLGKNYVLSFQEVPGDVFDTIRERIRNAKGRIRKMGADYLAYALCDAVVDNYFTVLEKFSDTIEGLEEQIVDDPRPETLPTIHSLKRDTVLFRKSIWPLREVINGFERSESSLLKKDTRQYLRDVYDHTIHVIDTVEVFRDLVTGMLDIYMSSISNKMNEVMKVLTIMATIFIPLTFVAGIYGMNFEYMPELKWKYSYFIALGCMVLMFFGMLGYFRKKKWL